MGHREAQNVKYVGFCSLLLGECEAVGGSTQSEPSIDGGGAHPIMLMLCSVGSLRKNPIKILIVLIFLKTL